MKRMCWVFWRWLGRRLRTYFLAGLFIVVPVAATAWILVWVFSKVDGYLQPAIESVWGRSVHGVGFGIMVVVIFLVGVFASNILGRRLISYGQSQLSRVPIIRPLYTSIKQILESFSTPGQGGLGQTVLIEFPRKGIWTVGFITNESTAQSGEKRLNVFIPTAPNPMTGFLQIVSEKEVIRSDIPVNQALQMIISAGKFSPKWIEDVLLERTEQPCPDVSRSDSQT